MFADGKSLLRNSGVGGGGENWILNESIYLHHSGSLLNYGRNEKAARQVELACTGREVRTVSHHHPESKKDPPAPSTPTVEMKMLQKKQNMSTMAILRVKAPLLRTKIQPKVFLTEVFLYPPGVMDVRAFGK